MSLARSTYTYAHVKVKAYMARLCLKLFVLMYSRPWTGLQYVVGQEANRMGKLMLRGWLTDHRIAHCARCLGINKTLRKANIELDEQQVYLCEGCYRSGVEAGAVKQPMNLVKP